MFTGGRTFDYKISASHELPPVPGPGKQIKSPSRMDIDLLSLL